MQELQALEHLQVLGWGWILGTPPKHSRDGLDVGFREPSRTGWRWGCIPTPYPHFPLPAGFLAGSPWARFSRGCPCALPQPAGGQSPPGGQRGLLLHHDRGRAGQWCRRGGVGSRPVGTGLSPARVPQALLDEEQTEMLRSSRQLPLNTNTFNYEAYHTIDEVGKHSIWGVLGGKARSWQSPVAPRAARAELGVTPHPSFPDLQFHGHAGGREPQPGEQAGDRPLHREPSPLRAQGEGLGTGILR